MKSGLPKAGVMYETPDAKTPGQDVIEGSRLRFVADILRVCLKIPSSM